MTVLGLSSLSFPSSSEKLFGRDAPLVVEIGVGSGGFIHKLAMHRPDWNVLGIDRAPQSIARTYRRFRRGDIPNVRLIKGNAKWLVQNVFPPAGLQRVYVNFPDPWPREKHQHRRLLQEPFLRLLSSRLAPNGELLVTTDHAGYFSFVLRGVEAAGCFEVNRGTPPSHVLDTKWARKASTHYHAALRLVRTAQPQDIDIELASTMYHAVVDGDLPDLSSFEKRTFRYGRGVVVLMDVYRPVAGAGFIFLVHVEEAGLSQEVIVELREGRQGYVVGLRRFGEPIHTRGVSTAVRLLTEWLAELGMSIIHKKY